MVDYGYYVWFHEVKKIITKYIQNNYNQLIWAGFYL